MARGLSVSELEARVRENEITLKDMKETLDYHNKILVRGNGQPSLVAKVDAVFQFVTEQKESYKYWSRWAIGGVMANIIGFTAAAVFWFLRVYPVIENATKIISNFKP